jgi:signal transduction histidine kinase
MDLTIPAGAVSELAAAFLLCGVTLGLAGLCAFLYRRYGKPYFAYWALAWCLFALRLAAIISFMLSENRHWLFWHQVTTGWTALAVLWAALSFSQQPPWRHRYLWILSFPPLWSYVAIYRMDSFLLAAGPAVLFLSSATLWTAWVFYRFFRVTRSAAALSLAIALLLWGIHHLDYPFLRARGVWNPWGYYLDLLFVLAMGAGILLLVIEDQHRGLATLSTLSGDLQRVGRRRQTDMLGPLLERPLTLPGVRGAALYLLDSGVGSFVGGSGVCAGWIGSEPTGSAGRAISRCVERGRPEVVRRSYRANDSTEQPYAYTVALPVLRDHGVSGALVIVGDARDPFAALDTRFLVALGQQVGAAMEGADLYDRIEARTEELERLATRMVQQHEEERRRLSRELHDETAQVFSAVKLQLATLRESLEHELAQRLDRALVLVDSGIKSIRNVTNDLRPSLLDDLGLVPALRALTDAYSERTGILVVFSAVDPPPAISAEAELALFRALQEGLANVARHAEASSVVVDLRRSADRLVLTVKDDGKGPENLDWHRLERKGHMGLTGMRERITALGGSVRVDRPPEGGLELTVELPDQTGEIA